MTSSFPKELLHFCRILGVFPAKNIGLGIEKLKFSPIAFLYSLVLVTVQVCLCGFILSIDLVAFREKFPVKTKGSTAIAVMFCQTAALTGTAILWVLSSGSSCGRLIKLYNELQRCGRVLEMKSKSSVRQWMFVSVGCLSLLMLLGLVVSAVVMQKFSPLYLAVYSLHFTALAVQLQYVSTVDNIRQCFKVLNQRITEEVSHHTSANLLKLSVLPVIERVHGGLYSRRRVDLTTLSDMHWSLCGAVHQTNTVFGWQLLSYMLSLFLLVIVTPYFFFFSLDIYARGYMSDWFLAHLAIQALWAITHFTKLLLMVLPCAATTQEAKQTAPIVCKLLNREMPPDIRRQLETFVLQLLHHNAEFSAFGLFSLQFPILTSIAGAVTTYLVILIQFQNAGSEDSLVSP